MYRYYRDLINFKARGNPALMLRCINPNEAKLLDGASGVHVKFRLAGVSKAKCGSMHIDMYSTSITLLSSPCCKVFSLLTVVEKPQQKIDI